MITSKKIVVLSELALLLAGMIWGSNMVVVKDSLDAIPPNWSVTVRSAVPAVLMFLIFRSRIRIRKECVLMGLVCGFLVWSATTLQTIGLMTTSAGNTVFLTATCAAWTPLVNWLIVKQRPKVGQLVTCVLCVVGIGFIALNDGLRLQVGDLFALACALLYALTFISTNIGTSRFKMDPIELTCWQFIFKGMFALITAIVFDPPMPVAQIFSDATLIGALLYSALFGGMLAFMLQNIGLKYAPVSHAALLLTTEAPFGCLFGILFLDEKLSLRTGIGFLLIFCAIVFSELLKNKEHAKKVQAGN